MGIRERPLFSEGTNQEESPYRNVGRSVEKVDAREKISGEARYEMDIQMEGLLHAAVVRTTQCHARIESVDTAAAAAMDGVEAVVTRTELLGLFDDRVRHYGDVIAAVAAEDRETAAEAVAAIDYELTELDAVYDAEEAVREGAPEVHPNNPNLKQHGRHDFEVDNDEYVNNIDDYHALSVGDVEAGFEAADFVYEGEYRTPRVNHCNLGTHCTVATWEDDTLVLQETLASPGRSQEELADFLGLSRDRVELRVPDTVTSSFGGKSLRKLSLEPVAATLSKETGSPVRLWFDREEEFTATSTRHHTRYRLKTGIKNDGSITAVELDVVADTGAYPNGVGHIVLSNSRDRPLDLYRIPNYEYEGVSVFTNNVSAGEYRGIGSTQLGFVFESHMDEIARQAGLDPRKLRERNFVEEGFERPHTGLPIESCGVQECLTQGISRFDILREGPTDDPTKVRGWGFAAGSHTTASGATGTDSSEARLTLHENGEIVADTASIDNGQGSDTVMAQMISEETDVPVPDIEIKRFSTTDELDDILGAVASRSTYIIGAAVRDGAEHLRAAVVERAAERFDVDPDTVALRDGFVHVADDEIPIGEFVDEDGTLIVYGDAVSDLTPPSYGVHFAEVEVDVETGHIDVLTFLAAQDVGFAINPKMVEGQLEGAVEHGTEFALFSEVKLDEGRPQNANLADYPAISPWEMPDTLECEIIESDEKTGPYGAKGIGTPSMPPVAPALLNALRDATGTRFREPPVDSEKVFDALNK
jgi:CO/xanthine dehydrogenase Mo-binding subunit